VSLLVVVALLVTRFRYLTHAQTYTPALRLITVKQCMGHVTFWLSISLRPKTTYRPTYEPRGV